MAFNDGQKMCTTTGEPVDKVLAEQVNETGQHKGYVVLCPDERAKGFVRPYRDSYRHVGRAPTCGKPDADNGDDDRFVCSMPSGHDGECLSFEHRDATHAGCGTVTTMGRALSETYQRDPSFYGATFCVNCNRHLPVSEFVWTADGERVGS